MKTAFTITVHSGIQGNSTPMTVFAKNNYEAEQLAYRLADDNGTFPADAKPFIIYFPGNGMAPDVKK